MKLKFRAALFAGAASGALTTAPQHAHAQLPVFDGTTFATQLEQYAEQVNQTATQIKQLEQQISTYEQMVQNATRLGNLPQVLRTLGLDGGQLQSEMAAFQSLNSLYSAYANGQQLVSQGRSMLQQQGFTLPTFSLSQIQQLTSQLYGPSDATNVANGYNRQILETDQYMQTAGALVDVNKARQDLASSLNDQITAASSLGDNSAGATLQAILAAQQTAARQNDLMLQVGAMTADSTLQEKLARIQTETAIAQSDLNDTQARKAFANAPVNDTTSLGWTSQ